MLLEGLVIHKTQYKERDLIVKLLLRNGLVGNFYIYGGQGGGKHHKPNICEPGSMLKILIKEQRNKSSDGLDLMVAAEYHRLWEPKNIRHNIQAFYLICLYFEIIMKISQPYHPGSGDFDHTQTEGIFSVLSNALFYLDDSLEKNIFVPEQHLTLFLVKLLFHLGIMPDTDNCSLCGTDLMEQESVSFALAQGQFICFQCSPGDNAKGFLLRIKKSYQTRYQEYADLLGATFQESDKLIQYFCHQFHLKPIELKSYKLLFK